MIPVTIITVAGARDVEVAETVRQWRRFEIEPMVHVQPEDAPRGPSVHARAMKRAIAACPHGPVLFCEDDVDIGEAMPRWLQQLAGFEHAVTLYLPGWSHYGSANARQMQSGRRAKWGLFPVVNFPRWIGSQCLYIPERLRGFALERNDGGPQDGGDLVFREWLRARGETLYYASPNPVQHRSPPSVTSPLYKAHWSRSYAG